jgi:cathepsin F
MRAVGLIVLLSVLVAVNAVAKYSPQLLSQFNAWQIKYGKKYEDVPSFEHAIENFQASIARVAANNKRTGGTFYGLTKFSDLSPAEFKDTYLRCGAGQRHRHGHARTSAPVIEPMDTSAIPKTFDWRDHKPKVVTAVKDQGQCGSCWAFSATENIESMSALAGNQLIELAPEQIVDCDTVDQGCNGGDTPTAFQYVQQQGGLDTEASYPYTAGDSGEGGSCSFKQSNVKAQIDGFAWVIQECTTGECNSQSKDQVQAGLPNIGPFAICVFAEPWQDYSGGIFNDATCSHDAASLDHCVQMVGYDNNNKYWIIRNSWNEDWGESGYIYVSTAEANGNLCGVLDEVNFVNATKSDAPVPTRPRHHRKHH